MDVNIMDKFDNPSPNKVEINKSQVYTNLVQSNKNVPPLVVGHFQKTSGIFTM